MVKIGISWVVIDKVRFWSNALGEKEIQDEMNGSIAFVHSPGKATIPGRSSRIHFRKAEYIVVLMITFRLVQQRRTTSGENSCRQHNSNPELIGLANRAKPLQFRFQNSSIVWLKDRLFKRSQIMVTSRYKLQIIISVDLRLHSAFYAQGIASMNLSLNPFVIHDVIPF